MKLNRLCTALLTAGLVYSAPSLSAIVSLDFEGLANNTPVGNFYSGIGVVFSPATLALIDADAGGSGNFANEPSPNTIMFFLDANNAVLDYAAGFQTGFSFYYTSSTAATVNVYDAVGGAAGGGNVIASINLAAQFTDNCVGDPTGAFCNFTPIGVAFGGTAYSIDFGGTANQTGYDNITFGADIPCSGTSNCIPEPASLALFGLGLAGLGFGRRKRT
ncbi:conserved exported hypothetical protein [Candidatus Accumulibacter aalborgensis]|uniref:Ice-binding protein C-terminal domain-containing protein n=1 Tax=Candidatus Accumulibacter aalborgensis TaxID=1860102 RepID=A0A1A8XKX5_9PROT|nr:PEP-CTERM sorting domain-containing protein [Candidatus Accumulibacter aalborgensis]SBT05331.1 conserved exported hypothetical protein [Candidatus Accumulibacter aalborgensis]